MPTDLVVRAGEWDTQTQNEQYPYQDQNVRSFVIHEQFYAAALYNDVALLFLQEPFVPAPNVGVACLPHQGAVFPGSTRCFVSGWGKDKYGKIKLALLRYGLVTSCSTFKWLPTIFTVISLTVTVR